MTRAPKLGQLIPGLIALLLVIDVAARFLPMDRLCFQAWECMTRFQEPGAIFEANRRFVSDRTHGNLSNMGNLPRFRTYRAQEFTTDARGFRNQFPDDAAPTGLVLGDSFVAGYGLSDAETFPVQLSAASGRRFYNAGGPYAYLHTVQLLKARLRLQEGPVVIVWTESEPVEQLQQASALANGDDKTKALAMVFGDRAERVRTLLRGWWYTSPSRIVAEKAFLSLANDRVLPNVYADRVVSRRLTTGDTMLFYPPDVDGFHRHRDTGEARRFLLTLIGELRQEGMTPFVVLAPSKYSVYYPLLAEPKPAPAPGPHVLQVLRDELDTAGVPAIDLTPEFQRQARRDVEQRQYIYWPDDTHWDGRGVTVAAAMTAAAWFGPHGEARIAPAAAP